MMKLIVALVTVCMCFSASSQTVNGIPLKDIETEYIQIIGTQRALSTKMNIHIDFGQENKMFSGGGDTRIRDSSGKNVLFNSMIDALNFMADNGYEFVQAFIVPATSNLNNFHYLLRRKKS